MFHLVVSSFLFALSFGLIKAEVSGLDPFAVAFLRLAISFLAFAPFLRSRATPRAMLELALIGFVEFGVMYSLYIASYRWLAGHQVAVLTTATPIWVVLIEGIEVRRISPWAWVAALMAVAAALVVVWDGRGIGESLPGIALVQGANVCFALGQILYRRTGTRIGLAGDAQRLAFMYAGSIAAPLAALILFSGGSGHGVWPHTLRQWLSIAYLGLVPSAVGFFLWNKGAARVRTATLAVMNNLKVPLAVILAWLLFGESIDGPRILFGLLLTFGALGVALRPST